MSRSLALMVEGESVGTKEGVFAWTLDTRLAVIARCKSDVSALLVDVFDTLLFRRCRTPDEVFVHVGRAAVERRIVRRGLTPWEFAVLRRRAEASARRRLPDDQVREDCTLEEIYEEFSPSLGDREQLAALEYEIDRGLIYSNPIMADLIDDFRRRGVPVYLVSNTYYSALQIEGLVTAAGLAPDCLAGIFSSAQEGVRKGGGKLFRRVLERLEPCDKLRTGRVVTHQ